MKFKVHISLIGLCIFNSSVFIRSEVPFFLSTLASIVNKLQEYYAAQVFSSLGNLNIKNIIGYDKRLLLFYWAF